MAGLVAKNGEKGVVSRFRTCDDFVLLQEDAAVYWETILRFRGTDEHHEHGAELGA